MTDINNYAYYSPKEKLGYELVNSKLAVYVDTVNTAEPDIDLDEINELLGKGNKEALKKLDSLKIGYTLQENDSGYTIKYSYKGTNYTITYYAPPKADGSAQDNKTKNDTTVHNGDDNSDTINKRPGYEDIFDEIFPDERPEVIETDKRFDYSIVDGLDVPLRELFDESTVKKEGHFHRPEFDIDSGGYDKLIGELSKMKPQLKAYIKSELEAKGFSYNDDTVDKYLNAFITESITEAMVGVYTDRNIAVSSMTSEITIKEMINYIIEQVDECLNRGAVLLRNPMRDSYVEMDSYLLDTADYFLSEEEQKLKEAMHIVQDEGSTYFVGDKNKLEEWVDTYTKHYRKVLKKNYPNLTDSRINDIIKSAKDSVLKDAKLNEWGQYTIDDTLIAFEKQCDFLAQNSK